MPKKYNYGHGGEAGVISLTDQMQEAKEIIGATKWNSLSDKEKNALTKYLIMKGDIEGEGEDYYYAKGGKAKERYKIIQDVSDLDNPSGAYLVIDTHTDKILAEFDFKKEAQAFLYDYQMRYGKMADGGMMAKGGRPKPKPLSDSALKKLEDYQERKRMRGEKTEGTIAARVLERQKRMKDMPVIHTQFEEEEFEYADGGMMADTKRYKVIGSDQGMLYVIDSNLTRSEAEQVKKEEEKEYPGDKVWIMPNDEDIKEYFTNFADGGMASGGMQDDDDDFWEGSSKYDLVDEDSEDTIRGGLTYAEAEKLKRKYLELYPNRNLRIYSTEYADGGVMMAKGGNVEEELYLSKYYDKDGRFIGWTIKDRFNPLGMYTLRKDKEDAQANLKELINNPEKLAYYRRNEYADGGMADGGGLGKNFNIVYEKPDSDIGYKETINANSINEAKDKFKKKHPTCKIINISEEYADGGMMAWGGKMAEGGFFGFLSKNKLRVGDILVINADNLPPMRNGSQYFKVLPSTKLRVEKINSDTYSIRRIGIDEGSVENLNQYDKEDINTFLKEGKLIKEKMAWGGKMALGGKTGRHRKKTLEEKAMESVGTDTWFQLDKETQAGVIAEMVTIGALPQRMAKGAKVAKDFSVTYELMDGKKVTEKYGSEEEMDEGIANFYIMNDVKDAIVGGEKVEEAKVEVKEVKEEVKPKKKGLFDIEKAAPKVSKSKETAPVVHVDGLEKEISRYDELKAIIKNADAEKEIIGGLIKDVAKEKYLEVYEQQGKRPTSIILESGGTEISYTVLDKYKMVTPEKETVLKEYDNLLGTDYTFTFDNEILDQKGKNGEKIADIINDLIENSDDIPDDVKSKLVKITKKVGVKKGSIEKLLAYKSPAEILQVIEPVEMLK